MTSAPGTFTPSGYLPVLVLFMASAAAALGPLLVGVLLRPRRPYDEKLLPYESGNPPVGEPRYRFSVSFYLIAMLFVVFDVELIFLYPWAVAFEALGVVGFIEMMLFLYFLVIGFVYAWGKGAFRWS